VAWPSFEPKLLWLQARVNPVEVKSKSICPQAEPEVSEESRCSTDSLNPQITILSSQIQAAFPETIMKKKNTLQNFKGNSN
jgi:hypothetical protein